MALDFLSVRVVDQEARPGDRREGHCGDELGVVIQARTFIGICPGPVKHVLAVRVTFQVQRYGAEQTTALRPLCLQQEVVRGPAGLRVHAPGLFQQRQKSVAHEGIVSARQAVPLVGCNLVKAVYDAELHGHLYHFTTLAP